MRKSVLYPALALALGILAAALRMWQRFAGYDESGLPVRLAFPSIVLTVFLLLSAGAFLYAALSQPKSLEDQKSALPRGNSPALFFAAAGVLVLAGGVLNLLDFFQSYLGFSQVLYSSQREQREALRVFLSNSLLCGLLGLSSVPAAAALLGRAKLAKADTPPKPFAVMMPSIFCWLWLIEVYRGHTSNPILWDYVLLLLAIVFLLISTYERAGFAFGAGKPRRSVFTSLVSVLLCPAALPDCGGVANALSLAALAALTWAELTALLDCFEYRPKRLVQEGESPSPSAETTQQEDAPHE